MRIFFAVVIGLLAGVASAQVPDAPLFVPPTPQDFVTWGALAAIVIGGIVRALRAANPDILAPVPSTRTSRNGILFLCTALGVAFGWFHFGVQVIPGTIGWIFGGVGIGMSAYVAAGAIPEGARGEKNTDTPPAAP